MKKKGVFGVVVAIVLLIVVVAAYFGVFYRVRVVEKHIGAVAVVYTKHIGEYSKVGPPMDSIYRQLKDREHVTTTRGFGLYYDNPQEVTKEKLRSVVGCVLDDADTGALALLAENGYQTAVIPASNSVYAEFPMKGMPSIIIGIFKVYPRIMRYQKENHIPQKPIMELYDTPGRKIGYIMHTDIGGEFYESLLRQ